MRRCAPVDSASHFANNFASILRHLYGIRELGVSLEFNELPEAQDRYKKIEARIAEEAKAVGETRFVYRRSNGLESELFFSKCGKIG